MAGILLAETEYRHQIEADIQPFRGLLLGVFFMSVGMGINIAILFKSFGAVIGLLTVMLVLKVLVTYVLSRISKIKPSTS